MGGAKEEHLLVIIPYTNVDSVLDRIRKNHPNIKITFYHLALGESTWGPQKKIPDEVFSDVTILTTLSAFPSQLSIAKDLHLVHLFSAGIDHIIKTPIYTDSDIDITTSSGIHGPQIAEWVLATHLSLTHYLPQMQTWQQEHKWASPHEFGNVQDRAGKTMGVLGYGSIGRQVGRLGQAMGMRVLAYTASPRPTPDSRRDGGYIVPGTGDAEGSIPEKWFSGTRKEELHHFLQQGIDLLVVAVPLTPASRGMLGQAELQILGDACKTGAFVSNVARGALFDQPALIEALKKDVKLGGLAGAALDTTDPEPLPEDSELWGMTNVLLTPHVSGISTAYEVRSLEVLEMNLGRMEKGQKLVNLVDRKRGY